MDNVIRRFPRSKHEDVPPRIMQLARDRTRFLLAKIEEQTLPELLANAYLQGINDSAQAIES